MHVSNENEAVGRNSYNRSLFARVEKDHGLFLTTTVDYLDYHREMELTLKVTPSDLVINEARLDIFRSPGSVENGSKDLPFLNGIQAFQGSARNLRSAITDDPSGHLLELLLEAVRALIQGEVWVLSQRGFPSGASYDNDNNELLTGSCFFYGHLNEITEQYTDFVFRNFHPRNSLLFARQRLSIVSQDTGGAKIEVTLNDSYHELAVEIATNPDDIVTMAQAHMARTPDRMCLRSAWQPFSNLRGIKLDTHSRKEYHRLTAGSEGCTHLADMAFEAARALELAKR